MRLITIYQANDTMILARPVYNQNSTLILSEGIKLTEDIIKKLEKTGITTFYVTDNLSEDIEISQIISDAIQQSAVKKVQDMEIEEIMLVAKDIVKEILENRDIYLDMQALQNNDDYTCKHSVNVAILSAIMGLALKMDEQMLVELVAAGLLHDIGKTQIDKEILNKNGRLTEWEMLQIKKHSAYSYAMLEKHSNIPLRVKLAVLNHHENIDGTGYPNGLHEKELGVFEKILRIADNFDALTTDRPYKKAYDPGDAIEYLMGGCGTLFDQNIVKEFISYVPVYPKGVTVVLSSGEDAIVVKNSKEYPLRPIVRKMNGEVLDLLDDNTLRNITIKKIKDKDYATEEEMRKNEKGRNKEAQVILIVSKTEQTIYHLEEILKDKYKIYNTKDAQQVPIINERKSPELIIIDVEGLNPSAINIVRTIQNAGNQKNTKLPSFIFIANSTSKAILADCQKYHISDYVLRPYKSRYIQERVDRVIENRKKQ